MEIGIESRKNPRERERGARAEETERQREREITSDWYLFEVRAKGYLAIV